MGGWAGVDEDGPGGAEDGGEVDGEGDEVESEGGLDYDGCEGGEG